MHKRSTLAESSSPASSSNLSSNSSREGSSGHTSSTSVSSGTDAVNSPSRRKNAAKTQSTSSHHGQSHDQQTTDQPSNGKPERQRSVTAFLNKLFRMVSESTTDDLIHWSSDGKSFIVEHQDDFSNTLLPRYFKHNTFASFVRQLNMYNFHKVPHVEQRTLISDTMKDIWEFTNPNFQRDRPDLLSLVYRKRIQEREQPKSECNVHSLLQTSAGIREKQTALSSEIHTLKEDFQALWKDTLMIREQQQERQESFIKIIRILSFLTRSIIESNAGKVAKSITLLHHAHQVDAKSCLHAGKNELSEDISKKLLSSPDTAELLKMGEHLNSFSPLSIHRLPHEQNHIKAETMDLSQEEVSNTISSTVRSVNAIANDINSLNRNVELLARKYNFDYEGNDVGNPSVDATSRADNKLSIIQYQHTGKRACHTHPTADEQPNKRTSSLDLVPDPNTGPHSASSSSWPLLRESMDPSMPSVANNLGSGIPTIAMRRATARALVPPIISETSLAERFQPQPIAFHIPMVTISDPIQNPNNVVDMPDGSTYDASDANVLGYDFDAYGNQESMDEFSGFFGNAQP